MVLWGWGGGASCGSTEAESSVTLPPFLGPEMENFRPAVQILSSGELRCKWTMLVLNEGVIRHGQTTARAFHAGRVVHARICVRKTENCADYSAKILEKNGDIWNQV